MVVPWSFTLIEMVEHILRRHSIKIFNLYKCPLDDSEFPFSSFFVILFIFLQLFVLEIFDILYVDRVAKINLPMNVCRCASYVWRLDSAYSDRGGRFADCVKEPYATGVRPRYSSAKIVIRGNVIREMCMTTFSVFVDANSDGAFLSRSCCRP